MAMTDVGGEEQSNGVRAPEDLDKEAKRQLEES